MSESIATSDAASEQLLTNQHVIEVVHQMPAVGISLTDVMAFGTLVATILMLIFVVVVFIKEIQIKELKLAVEKIDDRVNRNLRKLDMGRLLDEICGNYISDAETDRIHEVQKLKIALNELVYASNREDIEESFVTIGSFLNPFYPVFFEKVKLLYNQLWRDGYFEKYDLENEFISEFRGSFREAPVKRGLF